MESRKDCAATLNGDGVSHPGSVFDELLQATIRVDFERDSFTFSLVREASSPAPQRESVERSIAARGASLNVWSLSHRFETVEGIIFEASGNTRSAASAAWSPSAAVERFTVYGLPFTVTRCVPFIIYHAPLPFSVYR